MAGLNADLVQVENDPWAKISGHDPFGGNRSDLLRKTIRRFDQRIKNAWFIVGVAGALDQMKVGLRPGLV
ncbi:hypothetical protein V1294_001445 [Bradyrhizobium sp. AZCC 1678]